MTADMDIPKGTPEFAPADREVEYRGVPAGPAVISFTELLASVASVLWYSLGAVGLLIAATVGVAAPAAMSRARRRRSRQATTGGRSPSRAVRSSGGGSGRLGSSGGRSGRGGKRSGFPGFSGRKAAGIGRQAGDRRAVPRRPALDRGGKRGAGRLPGSGTGALSARRGRRGTGQRSGAAGRRGLFSLPFGRRARGTGVTGQKRRAPETRRQHRRLPSLLKRLGPKPPKQRTGTASRPPVAAGVRRISTPKTPTMAPPQNVVPQPNPSTPPITTGPTPGPATPGGNTMAGRLGFTDLGDQFVDRASRFEVGDGEMLEAIKELDSVGPAVGNVGKAMSILARKIDDEMPLDAKVTRVAEAVTRSLSAAAAAAELIGPTIRKSHFHDIHRSEAPRPGEKGWNVR